MCLVPGGSFLMGSADFYPEERPLRQVDVADLWVDEHPVTNAQFRRFVQDSGHVTVAERAPDPDDFPGADPEVLVAGSQVFVATAGPVALDDWTRWWAWVPGADWRQPAGAGQHLCTAGSCIRWSTSVSRTPLPTRVGREGAAVEPRGRHAARGGLDGATYPWGDEFMPGGKMMANTWHGRFPYDNEARHGADRTTAVKRFPPNGYGLFDVAGNVWGWTDTIWAANHDNVQQASEHSCCAPSARQSAGLTESDRRVTKGGSHLCAPSYCHRYRPAARQGHAVRSTTSHLGFRCCRPA